MVSSAISRQAAARGEASSGSILPEMGARWFLDGSQSMSFFVEGQWCGRPVGGHLVASPKEGDFGLSIWRAVKLEDE